MACIICFFEDEFQENLRNISQQRTVKFEDTISEYKTNFIFEFNHLGKVTDCLKHKNYNTNTINWASDLEISLKKINTIESYFDSIKSIYLTWINGKIKQTINELTKIIDDFDLLRQKGVFDKYFFFRGRYSKNYLMADELFHIPFDKRYLISNQRYSITGQPMIYLGLSILDVFSELKVQNSDFTDINFSAFILRPDQTLKVFDFTSEFESLLTTIDNLSKSDANLKFNDPKFSYHNDTDRMFYKSILISLCSFKRRKESENWSFCEEYVLPQLVTEIAREKSFDGILFTSTRVNNSIAYSTEPFYVNRHKVNLALFTKYNSNSKFDDDLIAKFEVSKPIKFQDTHKIDLDIIEELRGHIVKTDGKKRKLNSITTLGEFTGISTHISFEKLVVKDFSSDNFIPYTEHPTGQVHYYLLYQILLTVRNKLLI